MPSTELFFRGFKRTPYIQELFEFQCDDTEGIIEFDGYYYVADEDEETDEYPTKKIPTIEHMNVLIISDEPKIQYVQAPLTNPIPNNELDSVLNDMTTAQSEIDVNEQKGLCTKTVYEILSNTDYIIQIYKREKIQNTSVYSTIDDGDGEMNVCFFPTHRQRLYFRVLVKNPTKEQIDTLRLKDY